MNGYISINGSGININSASSATINGINVAIRDAVGLNKPIIMTNLKASSVELSPIHCAVKLSSDTATVYVPVNNKVLTVSSSDTVTVSAASNA